MTWHEHLRHDALAPLLAASNPAVRHWVRRDLLHERVPPLTDLWELPEVRRILARQQRDGRWRYPGGNPAIRSARNYDQLETFRQLGILTAKFGLDRRHPAIPPAVAFLESFQTGTGDFRGIYGCQYSPNYTAAITEVLIHAGYGKAESVDRAIRWLLSMRQDDGGWAIPTRTLGLNLDVMATSTRRTHEPDRTRPSAHLVTGIVLRALVAHSRSRHLAATRRAGDVLERRFFLRDTYPDHAAPSYWFTFSYPFWWTDLLSALDTLTRAGRSPADPAISAGLAWFVDHQDRNGLWNAGRNRPKHPDSDSWVALATCRMLARAYAA